MTERTLRVAVLSPQFIVTERLRAILATMSGRVELVPLGCSEPDPDVVLYDAIGLVDGDQTDLRMLVDRTTARLLVISRHLGPGLAALALAAGADGHFSLGADDEQIRAAIESAVTDWRVEEAGDGDGPANGSGAPAGGPEPFGDGRGLSPREARILALIGEGRSNSEMAEELDVSPTTLKSAIRTAYRKIGARNRSHAAAWVLAHGVAAPSGARRSPASVGR